MRGWDYNVVSFYETQNKGACPECGSLDVKVTEHKNEIRDSISFLCLSCGKGAHYDGVTKTEEKNSDKIGLTSQKQRVL